MFGTDLTVMLTPIADLLAELEGEKGDQIAGSLAIFTKKLYDSFVREGFDHDKAFRLTEACLKKGNS